MQRVFFITGASGTGKTSVAKTLAGPGQMVVHADEMFSSIANEIMWQRGKDQIVYSKHVLPHKMDAILDIVCSSISSGNDIIIDIELNPYLFREHWWMKKAREQINQDGGSVTTALLVCAPDTLYERLAQRGMPADADKLLHWAQYKDSLCTSSGMLGYCLDSGFFGLDDLAPIIKKMSLLPRKGEKQV